MAATSSSMSLMQRASTEVFASSRSPSHSHPVVRPRENLRGWGERRRVDAVGSVHDTLGGFRGAGELLAVQSEASLPSRAPSAMSRQPSGMSRQVSAGALSIALSTRTGADRSEDVHSQVRSKRPEKPPHVGESPVFRAPESFLLEHSVRERRAEDLKAFHKELLAHEVGESGLMPRANTPLMPPELNRKELSAKMRHRYPAREWHSQAPEWRPVPEPMDYYSVHHDRVWSMPSRGTRERFTRTQPLRPWE